LHVSAQGRRANDAHGETDVARRADAAHQRHARRGAAIAKARWPDRRDALSRRRVQERLDLADAAASAAGQAERGTIRSPTDITAQRADLRQPRPQAWVTLPNKFREAPKGRNVRTSIPNVTFVNFNSMSSAECTVLILERHSP